MQEWQMSTMLNLRDRFVPIERFSAAVCHHASLPLADLGLRFADQADLEKRFGRRHLSYDGYIVKEKLIPTRARNLHDYFNFLIWSHLPLSKYALHKRHWQYQQERSVIASKNRSRHEDRLTLFDEGGALILPGKDRQREILLFGHALWESMVLSNFDVSACAYQMEDLPSSALGDIQTLDQALAERIHRGWLETAKPFGLKLTEINT